MIVDLQYGARCISTSYRLAFWGDC